MVDYYKDTKKKNGVIRWQHQYIHVKQTRKFRRIYDGFCGRILAHGTLFSMVTPK